MSDPLGDRSRIRRVLLVRPSALGDVARTVPALVTLRRALPEAVIDWVVQPAFADVVRHHPALHEVVLFDRDRLARMWRSASAFRAGKGWIREIRARRYDLAVDLQGLMRSSLVTRFSGAPRRLGFANAREGGWLGYNVRFDVPEDMHTVDRMLRLLERAGLEPSHDMTLYVGEADAAWASDELRRLGIGDQPFVTLAPTARWLSKCWPIERYIDLARRLLDTRLAGGHIVVLAGPGEQAQVQPLLDALADTGRVHLPQTSVGRMVALLARTRLLVCNDSGALHIAVGLARPIAAIFGPTDPGLVGPYRRPETVIRPDTEHANNHNDFRRRPNDQTMIAGVTLDRVWATIEQQLALTHPPSSRS